MDLRISGDRRNGDGSYEMIRKGKIDKINLSCKSIRLLRDGTYFNDDYSSILLTIRMDSQ